MLHSDRQPCEARMSLRSSRLAVALLVSLAVIPLTAGTVSRQSADEFDQKVALIQRQADPLERGGARHTLLTQDELNSWLMYRAQAFLPSGVGDLQVTIAGNGRLMGQAVVDLDVVAQGRSGGGSSSPFSLTGGKVPVTLTGILHTRDGMARFEVQSAEMFGIPLPAKMLQELVSDYSRTPELPQGVRLDDEFALPANILQIEISQGQAVVVQ